MNQLGINVPRELAKDPDLLVQTLSKVLSRALEKMKEKLYRDLHKEGEVALVIAIPEVRAERLMEERASKEGARQACDSWDGLCCKNPESPNGGNKVHYPFCEADFNMALGCEDEEEDE